MGDMSVSRLSVWFGAVVVIGGIVVSVVEGQQVPSPGVRELDPVFKGLMEKADSHARLGEWKQVVATLQKAQEFNPGYPPLQYLLGVAQKKLGNFDKAEAAFKAFLKASPDAPEKDEVNRLLAELVTDREQARKRQEAARKFREAIERAAKDAPPGMVPVPVGEFRMGSTEEDIAAAMQFCPQCPEESFVRETPAHVVFLDTLFIDRHETTKAEYAEFLKAAQRQAPDHWQEATQSKDEQKPVIGVTWEDATEYCKWKGKRLPSEAEWEKAARGIDGRRFPWGNDRPRTNLANFAKCCIWTGYGLLTKVGSLEKGASPYGAHDMAGNVREWVQDWYDERYYAASPKKNPPGPQSGTEKVVRGGGWLSLSANLRPAAREKQDPTSRSTSIGIRCAKSLP